ncbi:MAG TPA: hypothetical protein VFE40_04475 [Jatrophihabitantaceae bacterium]|nr:hypothetical protein [Jatrophihabitantaceae bacterium]
MRIRHAATAAALVGVLALLLGGCTSSGNKFIPPTNAPTSSSSTAHRTASSTNASRAAAARKHRKLCTGLAGAKTKFAAAERSYYSNTAKQNQAAVQAIARELQGVEHLAPRGLRSPMHDMIAGFHTFANALAHPTAQSRTQLASLAQRLAADGKQISDYVTANCPAS